MSKSGSKALSKSVDASVKSVVKSVESVVSSVVPKNMNMKHVLLAILVGLLLCMLMGNTVEGYTCTLPATLGRGASVNESADPPPSTTDWNAERETEAQYLTAEIPKYTCETGVVDVQDCTGDGQPYQVNCIETSADCTATSGPFQSDGNVCNNYCNAAPLNSTPQPITASSGVCSSDFNLPVQKNLCATKSDQTGCESTQGCNWRLFSGGDSMFIDQKLSDPLHLRGLFNTLMNLAVFSKNGCPASTINWESIGGTDAMTTTTLPLITEGGFSSTTLTADGVVKYPGWVQLKGPDAQDGTDSYRDFFSLMFGSDNVDPGAGVPKPKMSTLINESTNLPADLKDHLYNIVLGEEKLWDELEKLDPNKTLFKKNGGRLIAGYNDTSGFVIRNSASQPTLLPGSKTRVHVGAGCPTSWKGTQWDNTVSCDSNSPCISDVDRSQAIKAEQVTKIGDFVIPYGDSTIRNYCKLDKCASKFPECQLDNLINKVTTAGIGNLGALI